MSFTLKAFAGVFRCVDALILFSHRPLHRLRGSCTPSLIFNRTNKKYPRTRQPEMPNQEQPPVPLGGGVLEGIGTYSLEWPAAHPYIHPAFDDVLSDECVLLMSSDTPSWMKRFSTVEVNANGEKIGTGRRFLIEFSPPQRSPYAGVDYVVEVRPPEDYPESPPFVRFLSDIDHVLVHDYGDVIDCFYVEANLRWSQKKALGGILHLMEALRKLLVDLPNHLVLTLDEVQRLCLKLAPHLIGKTGDEVDEFERQYVASLHKRQAELETLTRQKIHTRHAYKPLYPELFGDKHFPWDGLKAKMFHPLLLRAINASDPKKAVRGLVKMQCRGVWTLPFFTIQFCDELVKEFDNFESSGLPRIRPNSMNNYGLILKHIGMEKIMDQTLSKLIRIVASALFKNCEGEWLDHHHSFMVQYKEGKETALDPHVDDSEVTLNVCLGREFEGGRLVMCGKAGRRDHRVTSAVYAHEKGVAILHTGKHRHGALKLEKGERINLIIWAKSSQYRRGGSLFELKKHPGEEIPDMLCLSQTHDRDYEKWIAELTNGQQHLE